MLKDCWSSVLFLIIIQSHLAWLISNKKDPGNWSELEYFGQRQVKVSAVQRKKKRLSGKKKDIKENKKKEKIWRQKEKKNRKKTQERAEDRKKEHKWKREREYENKEVVKQGRPK